MMHSRDEFLDQLRESRLLSAEEISDTLAAVNDAPEYADARGIAGLFVTRGLLTAYQVKALFRGQARTLTLNNYIIVDELGEGGMGMVYRARHRNMKRKVALKVVSEQFSKNEKRMGRFHREVEASAKLNHPNIVTAYDAAEDRGIWYLVMELVDGNDLSSIVKQRGLVTVEQAIELILQAAAGSQYAHDQGVIHRDIKPSNLLLDRSGTVKILDMGLARIASGQEGPAGITRDELTHTGTVMGTVDYMAPEQAVNTKDADARSDIYSLGCTLWYLVTGQPLYKGDSMMNILLAHRDQPIPSLCEIRDDVTPELQAVFERMVAKTPDARYQTMSELISDLQSCRTGEADLSSLLPAIRSEDSKIDSFLASLSDDAFPLTNVLTGSAGPLSSTSDPTHVADLSHDDTRKQSALLPSDAKPGDQKTRPLLIVSGGLLCLLLILLMLYNPGPVDPGDSHEISDRSGDENPAAAPDGMDLMPLFQDMREDGTVHLSARVGLGLFSYNNIELPDRYRLELELLRAPPPKSSWTAAGTTHLQFRVGKHYVQYYLNSGDGPPNPDPLNGFTKFNQKSISERRNAPDSDVHEGFWLHTGDADRVVLEVHSVPQRNFGRIVVSINGEEKSRWQGSLSNFVLQSERFPNQRATDLIVGQWNGQLTIQSARLTELQPVETDPPELQPSPDLVDITDRFSFYKPESKQIEIRLKGSAGGGPQTSFPVADNYRFEFALEREGRPSVTHFKFKIADRMSFFALDYRFRPDTYLTGMESQGMKKLQDQSRTDVVRHQLLKGEVFEHISFDVLPDKTSQEAEVIMRINGVEEYRWKGSTDQFRENVYSTIHMVHWGTAANVKNVYYMPLPEE